jgi:hypothetical protein
MVELIDYIDNTIKNCLTSVKQFGLCHLLDSDNEKFPATVEREGIKAIPDDRFEICTYHRVLGGSVDQADDLSFGTNPVRKAKQKVRSIVFIKLQNDNVIDDIINAYPNTFETTNYYFANVSDNMTLIRDRENTWTTEFSKAYLDRYQLVWNIYAIEFDLEYIKCNVCV